MSDERKKPASVDDARTVREHLTRDLLEELNRSSRRAEAAAPESERLTDLLMRDAVREGASDIHLDPHENGVRVRFRIDGRLIDTVTLSPDEGGRLVNHLKAISDIDPVALFAPKEARWTYAADERRLNVRLTTTPVLGGEKLTLRILDPERMRHRLDELGLEEAAHERVAGWLERLTGMFAVAGPTGAGKTTTLYALLHEMKGLDRSVVTIEDPVEYGVEGVAQMQVDRAHGFTFAEGLATMARLDPDYLLLGEIRNAETAKVAVDASVSGRGLMTTLHSRDAPGVVTNLRNWGLADHEIGASLAVVVAQRLVRRLCPACTRKGPPTEREHNWLRAIGLSVPETLWQPVGCEACRQLGFAGRTGIFEVWHLDDDDYEQILDGADEHALRRHLAEKGFRPMLADGLSKVAAGLTTVAELRAAAGISPPGTAVEGLVDALR